MCNDNKLKQRFDSLLIKKIFSEMYYEKFYIRNETLDSSTHLYNFKKNKKLAFSICKNIYTYSHIYNNKFTFNSFLNKKVIQSKNHIDNFYNILSILKCRKLFFFLLKPIKGGFCLYFSGFVGFIPKNNIWFLIQKLFLKVKTKSFFILLYKFLIVDKTLKCLRLFMGVAKIKILQLYKKRNFSSVKKLSFRKLFSNSVFLFKNNKLSYEIKNSKKKYKTSNF